MMMATGALHSHRARIIADWVDYNGHLSEAYYVLIFGHATDALLDAIGMDDAFRRRTGRSVYTVDARVLYLAEVSEGEEVEIRTWVAAADRKRMLVQHAMYRAGSDQPVARTELVLLSVGQPGPKAMPFDAGVLDSVLRLVRSSGADCPAMPPRWDPSNQS
jgi:acyl-CoA thioesterase FadM